MWDSTGITPTIPLEQTVRYNAELKKKHFSLRPLLFLANRSQAAVSSGLSD